MKGMWFYLPQGDREPSLPCATLVGSPNYGYRSAYRDLEAQVAIVTTNDVLQLALHDEHATLFARGERVSDATFAHSGRRVAAWEAAATALIKGFF